MAGGHDPGGRSVFKPPEWVNGASAEISPCGRFRFSLTREWSDILTDRTQTVAVFIGLNPSTADGCMDDPTVRREVDFARSWGHTRYIKVNAIPYRATSPKDLSAVGEMDEGEWEAARAKNLLEAMRALKNDAQCVVAAFGKPPNMPRRCIDAITQMVDGIRAVAIAKGLALQCLGTNGDGSPKHPLYLPKTAQLEAWDAEMWRKGAMGAAHDAQ